MLPFQILGQKGKIKKHGISCNDSFLVSNQKLRSMNPCNLCTTQKFQEFLLLLVLVYLLWIPAPFIAFSWGTFWENGENDFWLKWCLLLKKKIKNLWILEVIFLHSAWWNQEQRRRKWWEICSSKDGNFNLAAKVDSDYE